MNSFSLHSLGFFYECPQFGILWGNRNAQTEAVRVQWPLLEFRRLRQVHGVQMHWLNQDSPDLALEGDGGLTRERGLAACIITADCMPIFILEPKGGFLAGLHCGWRGIAGRLVQKACDELRAKGCDLNACQFFLGPHIGMQSFEVDDDVKEKLLGSVSNKDEEGAKAKFFVAGERGKSYVSLLNLARAQIKECSSGPIIEHCPDTMTDSRFHSFRRDKPQSGRQVSFAFLR